MSELKNEFEPDDSLQLYGEDDIKLQGGIESKKVSKLDIIKKNAKWIVVGVAGILVVGILFSVKALNKSDGKSYYDIVDTIVNTQTGKFSYIIDVRTSDSVVVEEVASESVDSTEVPSTEVPSTEVASTEVASVEETTETGVQEESRYDHANEEWVTSDGTDAIDEKPLTNYQISINGECASVDPVNLHFDVSIKTPDFNDRFTSVYQVDGKYYIDVEQIRYWLKSSKDTQLIELSRDLPEGKTFLVVEGEEFEWYSPYAEDAEKYASASKSLMELYNRFCVSEKVVTSSLRNSMGSTGLYSADGVHALKYTDEGTMNALQNAFANIFYNIGDAHLSISDALLSNNIISQDAYNARCKEQDNIMDAFYNLGLAFKTKKLNTAAEGSAREYVNSEGAQTLEASWQSQFTLDGTDYILKLSGTRSLNANQVQVPNGSTVSLESFGKDLLEDTLVDMAQYLMPVNVKVKNQLAITPESIENGVLNDFIELVNSTDVADTHISKLTVKNYIEQWSKYEITDESTESERANARLVADFIKMLNGLTGDSVVVEYVKDETNQQFYTVRGTINGVDFTADYDEEKSTSKLTRVKVVLMNNSDKAKKVDATKFSLQTMISSKYPANNEDVIRGFDTEFKFDKLAKSVTVNPKEFKTIDLYFVTESGLEYFDLFYDKDKLGEIVAY